MLIIGLELFRKKIIRWIHWWINQIVEREHWIKMIEMMLMSYYIYIYVKKIIKFIIMHT